MFTLSITKPSNPPQIHTKPQQQKCRQSPNSLAASPSIAKQSFTASHSEKIQRLKKLVRSKSVVEARDLYFDMKREGFDLGVVLGSMLIDLFMKSNCVSEAFKVFEEMPERNVVTWTSMIAGCARNGCPEVGFSLFVEMVGSGGVLNDFVFNAALQACTEIASLSLGEQMHSLIVRYGVEDECRAGNCIIEFYSRCGFMDKAKVVFDEMRVVDLVSYTSLISGYCRNGLYASAVSVFIELVGKGIEPNEHTITSILTACGPLLGEQIHGYMIKNNIVDSVYCSSALIEFYARYFDLRRAKLVFEEIEAKNVVTWSSMISCCIRNERAFDALIMFREMILDGIEPNEFTFSACIGASGLSHEPTALGYQLHCLVIKYRMIYDNRVANALLTMYSRIGNIEDLEKAFERIKDPDIASWTALISGYFQNGLFEKSIELLHQMHKCGWIPNEYGLSSALSSTANLALLDLGRQFHSLALKLGCDLDVCTGNALVNMYAKCGSISEAKLAFHFIPSRDLMSWNSLIHGYAYHGHGSDALELFQEMLAASDFTPDDSTFLGVLVGCSHGGYVEEAVKYFDFMHDHGIAPSASHYSCMVDVMARTGRLKEAFLIIEKMPFDPDILVWKTLLASCILHKNLELGKIAGKKIFELTAEDSASYVLLSNLHALHGEWQTAARVRRKMDEKEVHKEAGWSWIDNNNKVHAFVARDKSHPESESIYKRLEELYQVMKDIGCSSQANLHMSCV